MMPGGPLAAAALALLLNLVPDPASAGSAPETTITAGPSGRTSDPAPRFEFTSSEPGSSFECRLDGGLWTLRRARGPASPAHAFDPGWRPCASPASYRHLDDGPRLFEVRAIGPAGEADPSPASRAFRIDTAVAGAVSARGRQTPPGGTLRVRVRVEAEEPLELLLRGAINVRRTGGSTRTRYRLRPRAERVAAGQRRLIGLRARPRTGEGRARPRLRPGQRATAFLGAELTNAAGGSSTHRLTVQLARRGR